jgi:hypothetical protein
VDAALELIEHILCDISCLLHDLDDFRMHELVLKLEESRELVRQILENPGEKGVQRRANP